MDIVKSAIGHDQDNVPGIGLCSQIFEDGVRIRKIKSIFPSLLKIRHQLFG